ncbi:MAG: PrsW family glutamic-type intramembrane protease [Clostridiales bacterium]|nr:PrsW family glutamic-type intramembrane protease [Clostridiales bacterium]
MLALLLAAVFPVIIFLVYIYRKDTVREPGKLVLKCFFLGCVATLPIIFIELAVDAFNVFDSVLLRSLYDAFVVAALVEEGFKLLFLYLIVWKRREFNQYFDGIVYAVFISLGFALVENIFYVIDLGMGAAIMRAILSVPGHGLFGVMMGYYFSLARFTPMKRKRLLFLSFLSPLLFHGLYDFFLMYIGGIENGLLILLLFAGFVALMVLMWRTGASYIKKHHAIDRRIIDQGL